MITGAPEAARWVRPEPCRSVPRPALERMIHAGFPGARMLAITPFTEGLRNSNFKVYLDSLQAPVVLRIYEHDASLCRKEVDLLNLVSATVPVAQVLHAEPNGTIDQPPFAWMEFVDGITFRELRRGGSPEAIAQAAYSAGQWLAAIHRHTFSRAGWLGLGPAVTGPLLEGVHPIPRFVDACLSTDLLQARVPVELRDHVHDLMWSHAAQLEALSWQSHLVHGDFNRRNLLVKNNGDGWVVAAVLDWEFAVSGTPLADIGTFLRYAHGSYYLDFSNGYVRSGGALPPDWRYLARLIDLMAVCESLTHQDLPSAATEDLVAIVRSTARELPP